MCCLRMICPTTTTNKYGPLRNANYFVAFPLVVNVCFNTFPSQCSKRRLFGAFSGPWQYIVAPENSGGTRSDGVVGLQRRSHGKMENLRVILSEVEGSAQLILALGRFTARRMRKCAESKVYNLSEGKL